jgi:hypothetical protein
MPVERRRQVIATGSGQLATGKFALHRCAVAPGVWSGIRGAMAVLVISEVGGTDGRPMVVAQPQLSRCSLSKLISCYER